MARLVSALERPKAAARWEQGIWLGQQLNADDHLVGTGDGAIAARSMQLLG